MEFEKVNGKRVFSFIVSLRNLFLAGKGKMCSLSLFLHF